MLKKRVIFYLIDGARPDILEKLMDKGYLPQIKLNLKENGSFVTGTTCFPSTTGPAYLPILTGAYPGDHNITGIRWFDKTAYFNHNRWNKDTMRSYCGYEAKYFNEDMNISFPSLFEEFSDGINIYNMITKGVKEKNDITKKGKSALYFNAHFKHKHHQVDLAGGKKLLDSLDRNASWTFAVFPSIDWDSHTYHFDDPDTTHKAYKIVDDNLGQVIAWLKDNNQYENTLIIMASDHGLSSTHSHLDLGRFFKAYDYRVLEYPNIFTLNPNVAISISGNSFGSISFLDKKGQYLYHDIIQNHSQVLIALLNEKAIDFVIMNNAESNYVLQNQNGIAHIDFVDDKLRYVPISEDVLQLGGPSEWLDYNSSFEYTFDTNYPDALWQCHQLMRSKRAGDVVVTANIGYDLRKYYEIPIHNGSHGSLHREHMHIPILANKKNFFQNPIRSSKIHTMIKNWLK